MPHDDDPFNLPEALRDDLRRELGHTPRVPAELNRLVTSQARASLAGRRRIRIFAAGVGIAAAVALMARVGWDLSHHSTARVADARKPAPAIVAGDLNGDGRVDILDASFIAQAIANSKSDHAPPNPRCDINNDGVVDQRDVDQLATAAVSINSNSAGTTGAIR